MSRALTVALTASLVIAVSGCGWLLPDATFEATDELWLQAENHRAEAVTVQVLTGETDQSVDALTFDVAPNMVVSDQLARVGTAWVILVDGVEVYSADDAPEGDSARKLLILNIQDDVRVLEDFWLICRDNPQNPACERPF